MAPNLTGPLNLTSVNAYGVPQGQRPSGTGNNAVQWLDADELDIRDWGSVDATGAVAITTALRATIAEAVSKAPSGYGAGKAVSVKIPGGRFLLDGMITVPDNVTITGTGFGATSFYCNGNTFPDYAVFEGGVATGQEYMGLRNFRLYGYGSPSSAPSMNQPNGGASGTVATAIANPANSTAFTLTLNPIGSYTSLANAGYASNGTLLDSTTGMRIRYSGLSGWGFTNCWVSNGLGAGIGAGNAIAPVTTDNVVGISAVYLGAPSFLRDLWISSFTGESILINSCNAMEVNNVVANYSNRDCFLQTGTRASNFYGRLLGQYPGQNGTAQFACVHIQGQSAQQNFQGFVSIKGLYMEASATNSIGLHIDNIGGIDADNINLQGGSNYSGQVCVQIDSSQTAPLTQDGSHSANITLRNLHTSQIGRVLIKDNVRGFTSPANTTANGTSRTRYDTEDAGFRRFNVFNFGATGDGVTSDTVAVQAAITAASSAPGIGIVVLPEGYTFSLGTLTPANDVWIWAYGAQIAIQANDALLHTALGASTISNFGVFGATVVGTYTSTDKGFIYFQGPSSDIVIRDNKISNYAFPPIYVSDCQRVWIENNELRTVCLTGQANAINVYTQNSNNPTNDIFIRGNYVDNCATECISLSTATSTAGSQAFTRAIVTDNDVQSVGNVWALAVEMDIGVGPAPQHEIIIANNRVRLDSATSSGNGIAVTKSGSGASITDPTLLQDVHIINNIVTCTGFGNGINCGASRARIAQNTVNITGGNNFGITANSSTQACTGDLNSTATVLNVSVTNCENGDPVTGTGIPGGTYILSGAGTTTWTLSNAATVTQTGQTLTIYRALQQVVIEHNTVHVWNGSALSGGIINVQGLGHSTVHGNHIYQDPGSTTTGTYGIEAQECGWLVVENNKVEHVGGTAIGFQTCNDVWVSANRIYNPSESGVNNAYGILLQNCTGTLNQITDNLIVDDRLTPQMKVGIDANGTNTAPNVLRNTIRGYATSGVGGTTSISSDNAYTSGARSGRAVLVAGTVTVTTAEVKTADNISLTRVVGGGTVGVVQVGTIVAGTSFVINSVQPGTSSSVQTSDTSTIYWRIDH